MNFHQATSRSLTSEPLNRGTKMLNKGLQQEAPSLIYSNCCCSVAKLCLTLCDTMDRGMPGFPVLHYLLDSELMSIESEMPSNHLIFCRPLLFLPSIFPSITVFSSESALHIRCPKYWSFSIRLSNEYSGLISFRIDWFDLLADLGTLKSLLQHYNSIGLAWWLRR